MCEIGYFASYAFAFVKHHPFLRFPTQRGALFLCISAFGAFYRPHLSTPIVDRGDRPSISPIYDRSR